MYGNALAKLAKSFADRPSGDLRTEFSTLTALYQELCRLERELDEQQDTPHACNLDALIKLVWARMAEIGWECARSNRLDEAHLQLCAEILAQLSDDDPNYLTDMLTLRLCAMVLNRQKAGFI